MKYIYIFLGLITLVLGIVGVFLPILPTVPFLLATVFFFAKGSTRMHAWFIQSTIYHKYLKTYHEQKGMTFSTKIKILAFASVVLLLGMYLSQNIYATITIIVVMIVKYWYFFFRIKTIES